MNDKVGFWNKCLGQDAYVYSDQPNDFLAEHFLHFKERGNHEQPLLKEWL